MQFLTVTNPSHGMTLLTEALYMPSLNRFSSVERTFWSSFILASAILKSDVTSSVFLCYPVMKAEVAKLFSAYASDMVAAFTKLNCVSATFFWTSSPVPAGCQVHRQLVFFVANE